MSSRRKDMWKLLYNLVNRNDTDLNEVFTFVDDILCKEPSLIRPYSRKPQHNIFQDTFLVWLSNKLVSYFNDSLSSQLHIANINIQKRIISSCLVNRSILFKKLVSCYVAAISKLSVEMQHESPDLVFDLDSFNLDDKCLKDIDNCVHFQKIAVRIDDVDEFIERFLIILEHSFNVGYDVCPELFVDSILCVLKAFKVSGIHIKMQCLGYIHKLFKASFELNHALDIYFKLTVDALACLWENMPLWIHAECVQISAVEEFAEISAALLYDFSGYEEQSEFCEILLNLALNIFHNVATLLSQKTSTSNLEANLQPFQLSLIVFMIRLQMLQSSNVCLSDEQSIALLRKVTEYPSVLRIVAVSLVRAQQDNPKTVLILREHLARVLGLTKGSIRDFIFLKELLYMLIYLEMKHSQSKQLLVRKPNNHTSDFGTDTDSGQLLQFVQGETLSDKAEFLNTEIDKFFKFADEVRDPEMKILCVEIAGTFFQIGFVRQSLLPHLTRDLISLIEKPLKSALKSMEKNNFNRELVHISMQTLSRIPLNANCHVNAYLSNIVTALVLQLFKSTTAPNYTELRTAFLDNIDGFIVHGSLSHTQLLQQCLPYIDCRSEEFPRVLRTACCTRNWNHCYAFDIICYSYVKSGLQFQRPSQVEIVCTKCDPQLMDSIAFVKTFMSKKDAIVLRGITEGHIEANLHSSELVQLVDQSLSNSLLINEQFSFILKHLDLSALISSSLNTIMRSNIRSLNMRMIQLHLQQISADAEVYLPLMSQFILSQVHKCLEQRDMFYQTQVLKLISFCIENDNISEQWLFHFLKITFFFLLHPDSLVAHEAVLCATEMCYRHNMKPTQLWHWYKRDALSLIVKLAVNVYLRKGVRLTRSLKAISKMLGFSCVQEFLCKYYRLLTTMILPYCAKEPRCKGLIVAISKVTRKPISQIFIASFLRIYTHIYLTEEASVGNKCIDLITKCTAFSLKKLMSTDVKQTVSEFLIYFNRAPKFVMQAFQCLLLTESATTREVSSAGELSAASSSSADFAKFIADRFLGVITYFEACLGDPNFEKPLKEEALYSLGQIIRFVGANHVTQFRFKIIAMLTFVLTLSDKHLQNICLKIWKIFLNIVNIEELGPSLSRIVASLQPLLKDRESEVNSLYDFIILKNDNLLGAHIPDLYFLEKLQTVHPEIRQCVGRQMDILKSDKSTTADKLHFLFNQITNENVQVRIYGLDYMTNFIAENRETINRMILEEIRIDPLMHKIVDILVGGSKHEDKNLQLASAKCLGELGAMDPSYMPLFHALENTNEISLSIHTDKFAIMALTELCRAYQFQKDSKYVDNFSLAIQETLLTCGVSPKDREKMNVWNAIPERMRQIMEPLLTSCYTGSCRESKCQEHPIFNSSYCRSYEDWAFALASRLIDFVQKNDTKHLLSSYKPSIKRDRNTLAMLFPYIIVHALEDCSVLQMQQTTEEFEAVFSFSSSSTVKQPEYEACGMKEFMSTKYLVDRGFDENKGSNNGNRYEVGGDLTLSCSKLCSEQIDFLKRWLREWQRTSIIDGKLGNPSDHFTRIETFVNKFDKLLIAKANFHSGEYARALMYLEDYIEDGIKDRLQEQLSFLIQIHGHLMDADSVEGAVYMKKSNLNLSEEIFVNGVVDRPQETIACYEQLMSRENHFHQDHIKGIINCYLRMEVPETALLIADGLWQKLTDQYTDDYFKECKSELLWRLCRYDELQEILDDSVVRRKTTNWNIQCSEAFLLFRQPQSEQDSALQEFSSKIDIIRSNILSSMRTFSGVVYNSYSNSYDEVIKLHLLREVEKCKTILNNIELQLEGKDMDNEKYLNDVVNFFADWESRLSILKPIVRVVEPILCFRRNLLIETKQLLLNKCRASSSRTNLDRISELINNEIGKLWVRSAQMNREAGGLQQAHISIMKAEEYEPKMLFLEKAKLLWDKGDQTNCFKLIEENLERIENMCCKNIRSLEPADRSLYAEAKFLQATFNAESMNICSELNLRYFKEAIIGNRLSEKCYVHLAHYIEKIYESFTKEQKDGENGLRILQDIMLNYARSLKYGFENVYQSMPRLLSLWLDFTSRCASIGDGLSSDGPHSSKTLAFQELAKKMNDLILNCSTQLPTSLFYTAFSQLLSRICHPSNDVFNVLRTIVIKLVENYPQQSLWMLLPIFKSSHANRVKRCRLIFTDSRLASSQFQKLLSNFNMLAERLIELTNKDVPLQRSYELSSLVKQLPKLFSDPNFSEILLPFEKYMQISLPIMCASMSQKFNLPTCSPESLSTVSVPSNPFPYKQIYIIGIKEEVIILRSAAKPKKIIIQCNDGKSYEVMVKPKDDLRKDFRLMEFNGLVKRYLHQDSQARHRRLHIRTYAAIPFNEECGLVEWLPKLDSFRNICISIYRVRGLGIEDRILKKFALPKTDPIEKKRSIFVETLLAKHPPVFHEWFRQRFPTPQSWYEARSSYVKSIAVMSIVGYILGLGDRHGENVLFDENSGEAVHVDFNCLFNQGENFAYPELVPFRLTHNMVFAMGPLGVEGLYRKCSEITLRVLKKESKTLMSVLRPFVYDLVALNRSFNSKKPTGAELTDPKAMHDVRRIEERLQGYVNRTLANSIPLSTEGQVNFLVSEATNVDNLASMYIGWGSYI